MEQTTPQIAIDLTPHDNSSQDSMGLDRLVVGPGDKSFLTKVESEYKRYVGKVAFYSRLSFGIEMPILVLSSINVSALVSTFFTDSSLQIAGKAISLALTTATLIMIGTKKLLNPEQHREKSLSIRNKLAEIKLNLVNAIQHKDLSAVDTLKGEVAKLIGSLEE